MGVKLQMGAIDIETKKYTSPFDAVKGKKYECVDCKRPVILRKGNIRIHHFAHSAQTNVCTYYEHPNEAQIHKDAKFLMQKLLNEKRLICFTWECNDCGNFYAFEEVPTIKYKDSDEAILEYRDKEGKWVADVALINNGNLRYIIEIKNTHQTVNKRPEPWYEVDAAKFIEHVNSCFEESKKCAEEDPTIGDYINKPDYIFDIPCIRKDIVRKCYGSFCHREKWVRRIPGFNKEANQDNSCILCNSHNYQPTHDGCTGKFQNGEIRVCKDCLYNDIYDKKIRTLYASDIRQENININPQVQKAKKIIKHVSEDNYTIKEIKLLESIPILTIKYGQENMWKQITACLECGRYQYNPLYYNKSYYAICKICFGNETVQQNIEKKANEIKHNHYQNKTLCLITDD